ncbi:hypothetical protein RUND412_004453 [Rhizina undulata]
MEITFKNKLSDSSLSSYKTSVYTTWELSFRELCHDAQLLLQLCAFLSNEDIPEELFRRGKKSRGLDWGRLERAMEDLFTFSLAKRKGSGDSFWVHPLVHTWTRQRINPTERRQNAEKAITLVASTIVLENHERSPADWLFARRILSHLHVCQEHISEYFSGSDATPGIATASSTIGSAYKELGFYSQAEVSYRKALAGREKALGSEHPQILCTVHHMALVLILQGRYSEALELYQRTLAGLEKVLGSDHPHTLSSVNNMAWIFIEQGWYNEALEMYQRSLAGYEKALGSDHPNTLTTMNNMALVFCDQGRYNETLEMRQRVLTWREKALGRDHPDTLTTVNNMALVFDRQGLYNEALEMYQRTLAGSEMALGSDHPHTLIVVNNMAVLFYNQGLHDEALEWFQRALAGFEKTLGKGHPHTLSTASWIARISAERQGREREIQDLSLRQAASTIPEVMPFMQEIEERSKHRRRLKEKCKVQ